MVAKGLKVGDTFNEGASYYIVEKVLPNGDYVSRRTTARNAARIAEKKTRSKKAE